MRVITYGTFDFFHYGHYSLLKRASELGNFLIVGISSDAFNLKKNKKSILSYEQRAEVINCLSFVDEIIIEDSWDQKIDDIKKYNIDLLVMGSDWEGKFNDLNYYCDVKYLPRTPKISTSIIKELL